MGAGSGDAGVEVQSGRERAKEAGSGLGHVPGVWGGGKKKKVRGTSRRDRLGLQLVHPVCWRDKQILCQVSIWPRN